VLLVAALLLHRVDLQVGRIRRRAVPCLSHVSSVRCKAVAHPGSCCASVVCPQICQEQDGRRRLVDACSVAREKFG